MSKSLMEVSIIVGLVSRKQCERKDPKKINFNNHSTVSKPRFVSRFTSVFFIQRIIYLCMKIFVARGNENKFISCHAKFVTM